MRAPKETFSTKETWKAHPRFPWYHISDRGQVRNTITNKTLKGSQNNMGYYMVNICQYWLERGKNKRTWQKESIHRLVAETFCVEGDAYNANLSKLVVNHKDLNKTNNYYKNLEWITQQENTRHYFRTMHEVYDNCICQ